MSAYPPPHVQPPMQPPQKSGVSKGLVVAIVAIVVVGAALVLVLVLGIGGYLYFASQKGETVASRPSATTAPDSKPSSSLATPSPSPAQVAAVAGGQTVTWAGQGISWTVPPKWTESSADKTTLVWRSPGTWEAASLIASVSAMGSDFPTEVSLNAFYDQATQRIARGEVTVARRLELDGVEGVVWEEARPSDDEDPQRLQWLGYRNYLGETQLVNIMLAARGKDFPGHLDTMYGVLYSTKIPH